MHARASTPKRASPADVDCVEAGNQFDRFHRWLGWALRCEDALRLRRYCSGCGELVGSAAEHLRPVSHHGVLRGGWVAGCIGECPCLGLMAETKCRQAGQLLRGSDHVPSHCLQPAHERHPQKTEATQLGVASTLPPKQRGGVAKNLGHASPLGNICFWTTIRMVHGGN